MQFLGKRKRTRNTRADEITNEISETIARWKDETGMAYSVQLGRIVGDGWLNVEVIGLDVVRVYDILRLLEIESVNNVAVHFTKMKHGDTTPTLVLRCGEKIVQRPKDTTKNTLQMQLCVLHTAEELKKNYPLNFVEKVSNFLRVFLDKLEERELVVKGEKVAVRVTALSNVVHVFVSNVSAVEDDCLRILHKKMEEKKESFVDFIKREIKITFYT